MCLLCFLSLAHSEHFPLCQINFLICSVASHHYPRSTFLNLLILPPHPDRYVIPPLGFLCFLGSESFLEYSLHRWKIAINLDPLLICIVAGYIATNQVCGWRGVAIFLNMLL